MGEFKQIQEILSKIGTEIFKIDEEMTEKNEAEDGNSISLKSPWHMKWDRQQFLPFFPVAEIGSIMHLLYFSYPQEILAQFVEWGKKVLSPYRPHWSVYFSISLLQIAGKHPVVQLGIIFIIFPRPSEVCGAITENRISTSRKMSILDWCLATGCVPLTAH